MRVPINRCYSKRPMPVDLLWARANPELPDARTRRAKNELFSRLLGWMEPIFCVNCGKPAGMITREWAAHVFWLCDECDQIAGSRPELQIPEELVRSGGKS